MTMTEDDEYTEAVEALLRERLTGADREFCERIEREGFADKARRFGGLVSSDSQDMAKHQRAKIRSLCLGHGVPLPN
jgi:hypothetical protein